MAKIIIGTKNIGGIFRKGEDVDIAEYLWDYPTQKLVARGGGKVVAHIRYISEYEGEGDGGSYFELDIPEWDYPEQNVMIIPKQKVENK